MSTRRLTTVSCDTPIEQVVEIIRRDGAVAISNFVSEETLEVSYRGPGQLSGRYPCGMDPYFAGTQTRRTARILAKSDSAVEVALNPCSSRRQSRYCRLPPMSGRERSGRDHARYPTEHDPGHTDRAWTRSSTPASRRCHFALAASAVWSRGSLAAHAGDYRLHRRERRDAGHSWQSSMG